MLKNIFLILLVLSISIVDAYSIHCIVNPSVDMYVKDKWFNTIGANTPKISTAKSVFPGQNFLITVLCADYKVIDSTLNLRYSIEMIDPDGDVFFKEDSLLLSNRRVYNPNFVMMNEQVVGLDFDQSSKRGEYTIKVVVHDLFANENAKNEAIIELVDLPLMEDIPAISEEDNKKWVQNYYNELDPETIYKRFIHFINSENGLDIEVYARILPLFAKTLKDNTFILQHIETEFVKLNSFEKKRTLDLLNQSGIECKSLIESLNSDEKIYWASLNEIEKTDPYQKVTSPEQQDLLWVEFFATGSIKPIEHLITTLDFPNYTKEQIQNLPDEEKMKFALYFAAVWSLKSNCKQHHLVFDFCQWIYMNRQLTEDQKKNLLTIIYTVAEEMKEEK